MFDFRGLSRVLVNRDGRGEVDEFPSPADIWRFCSLGYLSVLHSRW
jgi:hypothetical protein